MRKGPDVGSGAQTHGGDLHFRDRAVQSRQADCGAQEKTSEARK